MIVDLAQTSPIEPEFAGHLHLRVRQAMALARLDPVLDVLRSLLLLMSMTSAPSPVCLDPLGTVRRWCRQWKFEDRERLAIATPRADSNDLLASGQVTAHHGDLGRPIQGIWGAGAHRPHCLTLKTPLPINRLYSFFLILPLPSALFISKFRKGGLRPGG